MTDFIYPVRVYYEDTDAGGVVYYANYLKFMERARTEMLRLAGFEQDAIRDEDGVVFAVRHASIDYARAARFNDLLQITANIIKMGKASLTFQHSVTLHNEPDTVLCEATVKIACVNADAFQACPIPETIRTELTRVN